MGTEKAGGIQLSLGPEARMWTASQGAHPDLHHNLAPWVPIWPLNLTDMYIFFFTPLSVWSFVTVAEETV